MTDLTPDILLRLVCGLFTGVVIGLDRKLRGKAAGMRTLGLVSLGAATAVVLLAPEGQPADATSRVLQGLLTGVGFLGAGVIVHRQSRTQGLTTAAAIWLVAVLGAASGAGYYAIVIASLVLALGLMLLGGRVETALARRVGRIDRIDGDGQGAGERRLTGTRGTVKCTGRGKDDGKTPVQDEDLDD